MDVFAEVVSTLAYFALAGVMLVLGFVVLTCLPPGNYIAWCLWTTCPMLVLSRRRSR